jgi:hypothetical protein
VVISSILHDVPERPRFKPERPTFNSERPSAGLKKFPSAKKIQTVLNFQGRSAIAIDGWTGYISLLLQLSAYTAQEIGPKFRFSFKSLCLLCGTSQITGRSLSEFIVQNRHARKVRPCHPYQIPIHTELRQIHTGLPISVHELC